MSVAGRLALAAVLAAAPAALADPVCPELPDLHAAHAPEAVTESRAQFAKGQALQKAGKNDEACKMFESSLVLEPQLGNVLNVADCRERAGKLVEAHGLFAQAAQLATTAGDRRANFVNDRVKALEAKLVRITMHVADTAAPGLALRVAGCPVTPEQGEIHRIAVPGAIVVDASAPGRQSFHVERDGAAGAELAIDVPALAPERDPEADRKAKEAEALAAVERRKAEQLANERERAIEARYDRHPARRWTVVAGGVGVAALVTGAVFGVEARRAQQSFDSAGCGDRSHVLSAAAFASCQSDASRGDRDAVLANAFLIGGAAIVGIAAVTFMIDPGNVERPPAPRAALVVSPTSIGAVVRW
jgi:hypothetical protein